MGRTVDALSQRNTHRCCSACIEAFEGTFITPAFQRRPWQVLEVVEDRAECDMCRKIDELDIRTDKIVVSDKTHTLTNKEGTRWRWSDGSGN